MITSFEQKTALKAVDLLLEERGKRIFQGERLTVFLENIIKDIFTMSDSSLNVAEALSEENLIHSWQTIKAEIFKMEVSEAL